MRALVTGGTGFVGSAVVRALLQSGTDVVCLVRPGSNLANLQGLDLALTRGDLTDRASLRQALAGCDQLYHVAAHYGTRPEDAETMFRVNAEGARNVLTLAAEMGLSRIVHTSTIGTIGQPDEDRWATEEDLFVDRGQASAYARSKLEAEQCALELARQGAPVVVVNPCAPVGPRDTKPSSTGQRIIDYLQGRAPSFSPGGINFVAVSDVAAGHLLAAERGEVGSRYILGNAQGNLSLADFYHLMQRVTGIRPPGSSRLGSAKQLARRALGRVVRRPQPAPGSVSSGHRPAALTADPRRAIRELGLPQTPLETGLRQAAEWFERHGYLAD